MRTVNSLRNPLRLLLLAAVLLSGGPAAAQTSFVAFESGHVRPVTLSPDGSQLFAVNTPDNTLEIFDVAAGGLTFAASVPVGMEPVAVAARTNDEVWVVNHLSDSISIVDVSGAVPVVTRTLLVGDEPRDIVFAGPGGNRAFITTAHRGQHRTHSSISGVFGGSNPADPRFTTEGIDRADVWVFDATSLGSTIGGTPVDVLTFFSDTPRALATDGTTVYVAAFMSGNQTTVVNETQVNDGFGGNGAPGPDDNAAGDPAPEVGAIVKLIGGNWRDADNTNRNGAVNFDLPDHDVFAVNATTLTKGTVFSSVGTTLFNMAINPISGKVYVTNTESPNEVLFEGPGDHGGSTVQGRLSLSRVTILDPSGPSQDVQHLNQHINYANLHTDAGANHAAINAQIPHSLATPLQPTISSDGNTIYIPAFGSSKVGVFTRTELEDSNFEANFDPTTESSDYLSTGSGPSGVALDEVNNRLYVMTRFNNSIEVIDLGTSTTSAVHALHNPETIGITFGRIFLYEASATSGNGEASCSSCHIFGDLDGLAWNLGNPDDVVSTNNQPQPDPLLQVADPTVDFHPMKGPMTTQTLKGLSNHGAMHWRGDRADGFFGTDSCTEPGYAAANSTNAPCDEFDAFRNFIVAFEGLVGKEVTIPTFSMSAFTNFMLQVQLPPNPVRNLDNSLTSSQQDGSDLWFACGPGTTECAPLDSNASDTVEDCDGCHTLDPLNGFFGTGGEESFEGEPQHMKVPHLRNVYSKVGMFQSNGDQVRGTGILHDGSVDFVDTFLSASVFNLNGSERDDLADFVLAFPTDIAPIVGQQVTIGPGNFSVTDVNDRIALIDTRAGVTFESKLFGGVATECDVIVKTVEGGVEKGYARQSGGSYLPDDNGAAISEAALRAKANPAGDAQTLTYTAVPPGSGTRMGIDRDEDNLLNGVETNTGTFVDANDTGTDPTLPDTDGDGFNDDVEVTAGTDPTNPLSFPGAPPVCGDSTIEAPEQCDDGNTENGDCCSSTCMFESAVTVCRTSAGSCDVEETCTGSSGTCPADGFESAATECRAAADICDVAENCTGSGASCPADGFESAATECRAAADICDLAENCTGSGASCPADGFESAATECRAAADICDLAENCTGSGASCPADGFESAATECRAAADICDVAENCTGSGASCPADGFESAATECRTSTGVCDPAENCTGAGVNCPTDVLLNGDPCLDGNVCNGAEECVVGVCQPMTPLDCDDADVCTADSCDEITGCANVPIPECSPGVPSSSNGSLLLIVALMMAVGGLLIGTQRRFGAM
jgi:cysteine-rich repeat protein